MKAHLDLKFPVNTTTMKTAQLTELKEMEKTKRQCADFVKTRKGRLYGQETGEALDMKIEKDEWLESKGHQKFKGYTTKAHDLF
jgi:hypothetical protein